MLARSLHQCTDIQHTAAVQNGHPTKMGTCTTQLVTSACHRTQSRCRGSPGRAMATLLGANRSGNGGWRRTSERQTTCCSASLKDPPPRGASTSLTKEQLETDIVVIGSGIGGKAASCLCCAGCLQRQKWQLPRGLVLEMLTRLLFHWLFHCYQACVRQLCWLATASR